MQSIFFKTTGRNSHNFFEGMAKGAFPLLANKNLDEKKKHFYCFRDEFITLRGEGRIEGEVVLYNAFRVKINGIEFGGGLKLLFTEEVRL